MFEGLEPHESQKPPEAEGRPDVAKPPPRSPPGFRFSAVDAAVIVAAVAAAIVLRDALGPLALLPAVVLGHFFLFCNVFRVRRAYELAWAVAFVVNLSAWWLAGRSGWGPVLLAQTPVTVVCILLEILSPRYHGIGFSWLRGGRRPSD